MRIFSGVVAGYVPDDIQMQFTESARRKKAPLFATTVYDSSFAAQLWKVLPKHVSKYSGYVPLSNTAHGCVNPYRNSKNSVSAFLYIQMTNII